MGFNTFEDKSKEQLKKRLKELKQKPFLNQSESWEFERIDEELRNRKNPQANRMF